MMIYKETTNATSVYRDTSSLSTIRMDTTGDTGNLLQVMKNAVMIIGTPGYHGEGKVPYQPSGSIEAIAGI